jgi:uncharacterized protein
VNLSQKNEDGDTPLGCGCAGGEPEIVKLLISKGADINENCIHAAAKLYVTPALWNSSNELLDASDRPAIVRLLCESKVDINKLNSKGETALIIAVEENLPEMVQLLLEGGARLDLKYSNPELDKKKPLDAIHWSKLRNHRECTKVLETAKKNGCLIC